MRYDSDDVPVVLVDDDEHVRVTTRAVEIGRPRKRWREVALLVAIGLVIAAVGILGSDGEDEEDDAVAAPTTTSTTARVRRSTTSRVPRPTTTTSWPQLVAGTGPLLTSATGSAVLTVDGRGLVTVLDLDTGDRCTTDPPGSGGWLPTTAALPGDVAILQTEERLLLVDRHCEVREVGVVSQTWPSALTSEGLWTMDEPEGDLVEWSLETGERTGRSFEISPFVGPAVIAAGTRLVASVGGEMSLLDPADGSVRDLGTGMPVAANDTTLAAVRCPRLDCHLEVIDIASGSSRVVGGDEWAPVPWDQGAFSPDGRYLRTSAHVAGNEYGPVPAIVDLETDTVKTYELDFTAFAFTYEGGWTIATDRGRLLAFRADGETVRLDERVDNGMVLLRT